MRGEGEGFDLVVRGFFLSYRCVGPKTLLASRVHGGKDLYGFRTADSLWRADRCCLSVYEDVIKSC